MIFPRAVPPLMVLLLGQGCGGGSSAPVPRPTPPAPPARPPNIVLIVADDLGWGDLSVQGAQHARTPRIDALAAAGLRLTDFYTPSAICAPSRAALMTGRYGPRVRVESYERQQALPAEEITIAEALRPSGYATGIFGKWHLGEGPQDMPVHQGFDEFFGMSRNNGGFFEGDQPVPDVAFEHLSRLYLARAQAFIRAQGDKPFFLVLTPRLTHLRSVPDPEFLGRSPGGVYGDTVEELDWFVGQVVDTLHTSGIDDDTLVFFTSDNGPLGAEDGGGSTGGLRGRKGKVWEGGVRLPAVFYWPGRIPGGRVSAEAAGMVDLFPTVAALCGATVPTDRVYDGIDISGLITGRAERLPERDLIFFMYAHPTAVRRGPWKYSRGWYDEAGGLFDLIQDPGETQDLSAARPEIVATLEAALSAFSVE